MSDVPHIPTGKYPIQTWSNRVGNAIKCNQITSNNQVGVRQTSNGTTLYLKDEIALKEGILCYKGEYDPDAQYSVYDVVRVLPNINYSDFKGNYVPATAGTWVCVASVPDYESSEVLKSKGQTGVEDYIRTDSVDYFPKFPEPETLATETTDGKGRYWESLFPMIEFKVCVDGIEKVYYLCGAESGSVSVT